MGTNLYIGNLPFTASEGDVLALFEKIGAVKSCNLIMDRFTNKPRGFAFVEMSSQEEADRAIAELHGQDFMGRALTVNEARPREERPRGGGGGGGGGGFGGGRRESGGRRDFGGHRDSGGGRYRY